MTDFLLALAAAGEKALSDYPICAYFPEANRSAEVTKAMWTVAMGVSTYFWPCLPVTGSAKTQQALSRFLPGKIRLQSCMSSPRKSMPGPKPACLKNH